jgi:hypothetical protein
MNLALGILAVTTLAASPEGPTAPAMTELIKISASIDDRCVPHAGEFTVPANRSAFGFGVERLGAGANCLSGELPACSGWAIKDARGKLIYAFKQCGSQPAEERRPLSRLTLPPGSYVVVVSGGKGAQLVLHLGLR